MNLLTSIYTKQTVIINLLNSLSEYNTHHFNFFLPSYVSVYAKNFFFNSKKQFYAKIKVLLINALINFVSKKVYYFIYAKVSTSLKLDWNIF